jgi:hypothetical protein
MLKYNEQYLKMLAEKSGTPLEEIKAKLYAKDTLIGSHPTSGHLYQNGPFSFVSDDPISGVINDGSPLISWLPTRSVDFRFPTISHLEWVAPDGFDGSDTYAEYLRTVEISECGFGPHGVWSGFEYQTEEADWSFTSERLNEDDFGIRDFEKSPVYQLRGSNIGQPLDNDADWAVAKTLILMQQHMNYLVVNGDRTNSVMEYDGIDTVIAPGYVQSHLVGPGIPHWANPLVLNGAGVTDPVEILTMIRALVRKLRARLQARRWSLAQNDMIVVMPAGMWSYIADAHASGGNVGFVTNNFVGQMTYRDFLAERSRIMQGGLGYGFIDVDGLPIAVLPEEGLGNNVTLNAGADDEGPGVAGDIFVLTRRANGMTLLEQQYVDWSRLDYPTNGTEDIFTIQNGIMKGGWLLENNVCFQYYLKARGRFVSNMQTLQGRINNVAVSTLMTSENEGANFWSPDFYAYDGAQGGAGVNLLTPL